VLRCDAGFGVERADANVCGFIGVIRGDGRTGGGETLPLENGLPFLQRRGPDSHHAWQSADGRVALLHVRLAIVDQDRRAEQPFTDPQSGLTIAFNGEVYNYSDLRAELGDYPFQTNSDTEVLLAIFARWGVAGLKRLRGMFACVIIDERRRRIYLFRDAIGKKPLYYARWPDGVRFGSSVLPLVATTRGRIGLRHDLLPTLWEHAYIPPDESVFADCRPIAPGEVVELGWEGEELGRASCRPEPRPPTVKNPGEVQEVLAYLLRESVTRRMHNNPNPVSLLSGGIDSTVVTWMMRQVGGGSAITLGSLLPQGLDEKYARYAAKQIGIPLEVLPTQINGLEEDIDWALGLQDEPLGMISFFPLAMLLRVAKGYGKILLTGDGGDEVFLGYGNPENWIDPSNGANRFSPRERGVVVGVPAPEWMSPWGQHAVGHSLLGHMFPKLDRASAEQGVEARCPLLGWDLLAFVRTLRPEQLFLGNKAKGLLKEQLAGWSRWFVHRPKIGFAYRIRWMWGLRRYAGLREMVSPEAIAAFGEQVPSCLRRPPQRWRSWHIFRNFTAAWKLLVWSHFARRLERAEQIAQGPPALSVPHPNGVSSRAPIVPATGQPPYPA
jgi:asparagine synthase (glutamine-hydrolysing)